MIRPLATVPMTLHIMTPEDRTGRGGDHIPFRQKGFASMRFTSANENGDANVSNPGYNDRQHTADDILGVDTDADMQLDSFFVDFNYLARNAVINGNAAAMAALGPFTPDFDFVSDGNSLFVTVTDQTQYPAYRLGLRTNTNDWDTVYTLSGTGPAFTVNLPDNGYIASMASVDFNGIESLFSAEKMLTIDDLPEQSEGREDIELLQNKPNPFDEATTITVRVNTAIDYLRAFITVHDIDSRLVARLPLSLLPGINEVEFRHGYHAAGTFVYSLEIDGKVITSKKMVFNN